MRRETEPRHWPLLVAIPAGVALLLGFAYAQDRGPVLCRHARADRGASAPLDVGEFEREYARIRKSFERTIDVKAADLKSLLDRPIDAGLPACRAVSARSVALGNVLPAEHRGRSFLVLSILEPDGAKRIAGKYPAAILLVARARSLPAVASLAEELKRPIDLVTPEFAAALSVRCTPTLVTVSLKGDRLELREGE